MLQMKSTHFLFIGRYIIYRKWKLQIFSFLFLFGTTSKFVNVNSILAWFLWIILPIIIDFGDSSTNISSVGFLKTANVRTVVQYNRPGWKLKEHGVLNVVFIPTFLKSEILLSLVMVCSFQEMLYPLTRSLSWCGSFHWSENPAPYSQKKLVRLNVCAFKFVPRLDNYIKI